jgi:hypothetical protein
MTSERHIDDIIAKYANLAGLNKPTPISQGTYVILLDDNCYIFVDTDSSD